MFKKTVDWLTNTTEAELIAFVNVDTAQLVC